MKFITRRPAHNDLDRPSTYAEQVLHITDAAMADAKSPYCRNNKIAPHMWRVIELEPSQVHPSHICGACWRRLKGEGVDVGLLS